MKSLMVLFFYLISLLVINKYTNNLHLTPFLVSCSPFSSSSHSNNNSSSISSMLCHPEESAALLGFMNSMAPINDSNPNIIPKIRSWKKGSDCCGWDGIKCDPASHHVVELYLEDSGLVGTLDSNNTLFHLHHLRHLDLSENDFNHSPISSMFGSSFPQLEFLDLSFSNFSGHVPVEISRLSKLQYLSLWASINGLLEMKMATFHNIVSNMTNLIYLQLNDVNVDSTILLSLSNLSSLTNLFLRNSNLRGELPANVLNMPKLESMDLGGNQDLHGNFPPSNWSISLKIINLSSVNFSSKLPSSSPIPSRLAVLILSGCNFHGQIPDWVWNIFTSNNSTSRILDLSDNQFTGNINLNGVHSLPQNLDNTESIFGCLNISHNYLTGSLTNLPWNYLLYIDLSYNMFDGPLPIPPVGNIWFSTSNNNFTGPIPSSFCNVTTLEILDLSSNSLIYELPHCLGNLSNNLVVLNLGSNLISGTLPGSFSNCSTLEYLDLSDNQLEGLAPQSLAHCNNLQVLNLRKNKLRQEFPQWLATLSHVRVVDLSRNFFFGSLPVPKVSNPFPRLQVLDLSNNNFSGEITVWYIESFKVMMNITQSGIGGLVYLESGDKIFYREYFYSTTITFNGETRKYDKIITSLAIFDLSNNKFEGEIPDNIGKLVSIHGLNLSHNQLVGPIPRSLGNLTLLNFLDLSFNKLTGRIPQELTSLTSLGVFNVSENELVGPIPHGNNFNTYSADSYNGNLGLCGFPLPDCGEHGRPRLQPSKNGNKDDDEGMMSDWKVVMMGYGFGMFVSFSWGCYMLSIGRPLWLLKLVLILVDTVEMVFGRRRR